MIFEFFMSNTYRYPSYYPSSKSSPTLNILDTLHLVGILATDVSGSVREGNTSNMCNLQIPPRKRRLSVIKSDSHVFPSGYVARGIVRLPTENTFRVLFAS